MPPTGDASAMPAYEGDGNIYNPAGGGCVGTVAGTNYATVNGFAEYWYVLQYTTIVLNKQGQQVVVNPITSYGSGGGIGTRAATGARSRRPQPLFPPPAAISAWPPTRETRSTPAPRGFTTASKQAVIPRSGTASAPRGRKATPSTRGPSRPPGRSARHSPSLPPPPPAPASTTPTATWSAPSGAACKSRPARVTAYWNGLKDNNAPAPNGHYTIKLLRNDVQYVWDGTMNNSSARTTVPTSTAATIPSIPW